jgi:isoquinoline 1-oxidoreductase alpha subunit
MPSLNYSSSGFSTAPNDPHQFQLPPLFSLEIYMTALHINGQEHKLDADPGTPILWALRDSLGMSGTKFGCGAGLCGACTILLDGQAVRSCITPISVAAGKKIATIEVMTDGSDRVGAAVHAAWVKHDVAQCGYCQSGQIMTATAFLKSIPRGKLPSPADIDSAMTGNICRCGTYPRIRAAVADAARALA